MPRFSETLMDHFQAPRNQGRLLKPDRVGAAGTPGQGRFITLYLRLELEKITEARFESNGCGITIACGSALTELVEQRTLTECRSLSPKDIELALDGLPSDKFDCAIFAIVALRSALDGSE